MFVPPCLKCGKGVDLSWVNCPFCGYLLPAGLKSPPSQHYTKAPPYFQPPFSFSEQQYVIPPRSVSNRLQKALNPIPVFLIIGTILVILIVLLIVEDEPEYQLEYSSTNAYLLISEFTADNGEQDRMFDVTIYYDDQARGTQKTGEKCTALEYYDSARTYYLDEVCTFNYANPDPGKATITYCAEYVSSGRNYDIWSQSSSGGACITGDVSILGGTFYDITNLATECSYDGEVIEDKMRPAKMLGASGFDDGDNNLYNGEIEAILGFVSSYRCVME